MLPMLAFVVSTVLTIGSGPSSSPRLPEYPHVRATDRRVAKLIAETVRRSPTFASLHAALQRTDVILFVELAPSLHPSLRGRLYFVQATPLARYLRADIRPNLPRAEMIEAIAHELQHALEIAQTDTVHDAATLDVLYRRIGSSKSPRHHDTESAYGVAARVRAEASEGA
jgi:hypothetical protein